jgi:RHS repeat-associated protein
VQEDHYYPFGLQQSGAGYTNTTLLNKYLFNGKEKQDQTGMYDYGFRQLDPVLGRWFCVDRMAEKYLSTSPYAYAGNNPINNIDILGLETEDWYIPDRDGDGRGDDDAEPEYHEDWHGPHEGYQYMGAGVPAAVEIIGDDNNDDGDYRGTDFMTWRIHYNQESRSEANSESATPSNSSQNTQSAQTSYGVPDDPPTEPSWTTPVGFVGFWSHGMIGLAAGLSAETILITVIICVIKNNNYLC